MVAAVLRLVLMEATAEVAAEKAAIDLNPAMVAVLVPVEQAALAAVALAVAEIMVRIFKPPEAAAVDHQITPQPHLVLYSKAQTVVQVGTQVWLAIVFQPQTAVKSVVVLAAVAVVAVPVPVSDAPVLILALVAAVILVFPVAEITLAAVTDTY
jgi:hypothetical protein